MPAALECHPVTSSRWTDFTQLFGKNGACGGCWCMLWRLSRKQFEARKGSGNRRAMKKLVDADKAPGLIGYLNDQPVGWCALAPRSDYSALARSRVMKPVDDRPCWSISCLFVHRRFRQRGVATELLRAAVQYAWSRGATIVEGYPVEPKTHKPVPAAFAWTGVPAVFLAAGFREVDRQAPTRPIMRIERANQID